MNECSVEGCDRSAQHRGWCHAHYMRWWYTGDVQADRPWVTKNRPAWEKILERLEVTPSGCWRFAGAINKHGYGTIKDLGRTVTAHRALYEHLVGPIPDGMQLDHLCHTNDETCTDGRACLHRRCVNPEHLEPVDNATNRARGRIQAGIRKWQERITHCPQGHEYNAENLRRAKNGYRYCRACVNARNTIARARRRAAS